MFALLCARGSVVLAVRCRCVATLLGLRLVFSFSLVFALSCLLRLLAFLHSPRSSLGALAVFLLSAFVLVRVRRVALPELPCVFKLPSCLVAHR